MNIKEKFQGILKKNEEAIWMGHPQKGFKLRPYDLVLIPLSFVVLYLLISSSPLFFASKGNLLSTALYLLALTIITVLLFGRFLMDHINRKKTYYCLTKERVIIKTGIFSKTYNTIYLNQISELSLSHHWNHTGTIHFGPQLSLDRFFRKYDLYGLLYQSVKGNPSAFEYISEASEVYQKIEELRSRDLED